MKGIQDLIRPCATLARYEAALAAGTITQDVMVFIADVRQIRWKGEIYDCSVTAITEEGKTFIHADGLNDSDDGYYFLPSSAPGDDPAHTFAMLSDLEGAGGVSQEDFDTLYDGVVEAEEVTATALNELNALAENLKAEAATKKELENTVATLATTANLEEAEEVTATALNELNALAENLKAEAATKKELENTVATLATTANLEEAEEVTATALNELNARVNGILTRLSKAGI